MSDMADAVFAASGWRLLVRGQMTGRSVLTEVVTGAHRCVARFAGACLGAAAAPVKKRRKRVRRVPIARRVET